ncbi:unnamed protein product [Amoebophrya sp. A120]|nr:unnamed protein product [Amoebophrya sp. A120]|eukprot:GSA120T00002850001.1
MSITALTAEQFVHQKYTLQCLLCRQEARSDFVRGVSSAASNPHEPRSLFSAMQLFTKILYTRSASSLLLAPSPSDGFACLVAVVSLRTCAGADGVCPGRNFYSFHSTGSSTFLVICVYCLYV